MCLTFHPTPSKVYAGPGWLVSDGYISVTPLRPVCEEADVALPVPRG